MFIIIHVCQVFFGFCFCPGEERKYPADIRVKFPVTTAMLASNITLECFALGKYVFKAFFVNFCDILKVSRALGNKLRMNTKH